LAKFKHVPVGPPRVNITVGDFLQVVKDTNYLRLRTFLNYQNCFRTIVSEAFGLKTQKSKFDYRQGGNQEWTKRIDSVRLERVKPEVIGAWQQLRVKRAGHSPVAVASAKRTINSYVRCSRSLFSKEILSRIGGVQPSSRLPFDGVRLFESGSVKYVSKIDLQALITAARNELCSSEVRAILTNSLLSIVLSGIWISPFDGRS
jgi:hypothetical protein